MRIVTTKENTLTDCELPERFDLGKWGHMFWCQWKHPLENRKVFSKETIDELDQRCDTYRRGVAVDIGGFTGDTAIPLGFLFDKVLAFEPNPVTYDIMVRNLKANPHIENVRPLNIAITPEAGPYKFVYNQGYCNGGMQGPITPDHNNPVAVVGMELQDLVKDTIDYLKIDIEGGEADLLEANVDRVKADRPIMFVEEYIHHTDAEKARLKNLLEVELEYNLVRYGSMDWVCIPS